MNAYTAYVCLVWLGRGAEVIAPNALLRLLSNEGTVLLPDCNPEQVSAQALSTAKPARAASLSW
jgi:hypothetical protein